MTYVRKNCDFAYVIQAKSEDRVIIKVGKSANPAVRISGLKSGVPFPIETVAILLGGSHREAEMKKLLQPYKLQGEWFEQSFEINDYLRACYEKRAVVQFAQRDEGFFENHIKPSILDYLNGRQPNFSDKGDFVARCLRDGFPAIDGRWEELLDACPGAFTPEVLAGYLPLSVNAPIPLVSQSLKRKGAAA